MRKTIWLILGFAIAARAVCAAQMKEIAPGIFMHTDSCNSYCIRSGDEAILIDCGKGDVQDALPGIGVKRVAWILHTHPHRDLCQGDNAFQAQGAKIAVPEGTREYFESATEHWQKRNTYGAYHYGPKFFLPLRDIPVERTMADGDVFEWKDIKLRTIATPGHTETHVSYILERDGKKYIFSGDVIHSPGRLWELDSLQSMYEEFIHGGKELNRIPELRASIGKLRDEAPDMLLPAHGDPFGNCAEGLTMLEGNVNEMMKILNGFRYFDTPPSSPPELKTYQTGACQYFIVREDGHALMFDAGFDVWPPNTKEKNLTAWLAKQDDIKAIDVITLSHYHGDHIESTNKFVEKYGSKVYVHEILTETLEQPQRLFKPCLVQQPIAVDRSFKDGESYTWGDWTISFYHFPGQTYWHQAALAEKDGVKILFTGDSVDGFNHIRCIDTFNINLISDTEGAAQCVKLLAEIQPDYIATGHWSCREWKPEYVEQMRAFVRQRNGILRKLIAQDDPNMGYDIYWARLDPFRPEAAAGQSIAIAAKIRNHLEEMGNVELRINAPEGWDIEPATLSGTIAAKSEGTFEFTLTLPKNADGGKRAIGLDTTLNGRAYGEVGMAVVEVKKSASAASRAR